MLEMLISRCGKTVSRSEILEKVWCYTLEESVDMPINDAFSTNSPSLQGLRVLVVDNNADSGDLMMLMLQPYGVEVQAASLVQPALEIFVQWQPDVLVSEIALPKEDGFTLIRPDFSRQVLKCLWQRGLVMVHELRYSKYFCYLYQATTSFCNTT